MFEIPSNSKIEKCIITKDTVINNAEPKLIINENKKALNNNARKVPKKQKETA